MGRMYWMAVRMYLPTMACLLGALVATWALTNLGQSQYTAPLAASLSWMPYGLLGPLLGYSESSPAFAYGVEEQDTP
jgi:hypothetical protein